MNIYILSYFALNALILCFGYRGEFRKMSHNDAISEYGHMFDHALLKKAMDTVTIVVGILFAAPICVVSLARAIHHQINGWIMSKRVWKAVESIEGGWENARTMADKIKKSFPDLLVNINDEEKLVEYGRGEVEYEIQLD